MSHMAEIVISSCSDQSTVDNGFSLLVLCSSNFYFNPFRSYFLYCFCTLSDTLRVRRSYCCQLYCWLKQSWKTFLEILVLAIRSPLDLLAMLITESSLFYSVLNNNTLIINHTVLQRSHYIICPLSASRRMTTRQTCSFRQPAPPPVVSAMAAEDVLSHDLPSAMIPKTLGLSVHQHDIKICSVVSSCFALEWTDID